MKTFTKTSTKRKIKKVYSYEDLRSVLSLPEGANIWVEPTDDLEIISIEPGAIITAEYQEIEVVDDKGG